MAKCGLLITGKPGRLSHLSGQLADLHAHYSQSMPDGRPLTVQRSNAEYGPALPPIVAVYRSILLRVIPPRGPSEQKRPPLHVQLADFLSKMGPHLDDDTSLHVIESCEEHGLCMPSSPYWMDNIQEVLEVFYSLDLQEQPPPIPYRISEPVRERAGSFLFDYVWDYVKEYSEWRAVFVTEVVLKLAEKCLHRETNPKLLKSIWEMMISSAVAETVESDAQRRASAGTIASSTSLHSETDIFRRVRDIALTIATQSPCELPQNMADAPNASQPRMQPIIGSPTEEGEVRDGAPGARAKETVSTGLMSLVGTLSPTFGKSKELPSIATTVSEASGNIDGPQTVKENPLSPITPSIPRASSTTETTPHATCQSLAAVTALIAIFTRLAFLTPNTLVTTDSRIEHLPASSTCRIIFRDLLQLLSPHSGWSLADGAKDTVAPAQCPNARLTILQWLMRLRANKQHRVWVKPDLNEAANTSAEIVGRAGGLQVVVAAWVAESGNAHRRHAHRNNDNSVQAEASRDERGRDARVTRDDNGRSRSRSRQPRPAPTSIPPSASSIPLWAIPETLGFECPPDSRPSEGMTTYDPAAAKGTEQTGHSATGVWLPVSEYIQVLIDIFTLEKSWDILSYALVFFPLQLTNKHFFCGPKATAGVQRLRDVVCNALRGDRNIGKATLPVAVKRTEVRAAAYQILIVLISYKKLFTKQDLDDMVEAFSKGLRETSAKACVQALTIATYEMHQSLAKYLPAILPVLSQIMSNSTMSIHILEMLAAIGQVPELYMNFKDEHYRLIFKVALAYIQLHNDDRHPLSLRQGSRPSPSECESITLAAHVIGLSYFTIYTWFLAVKLSERPSFIPELTQQLLLANADKTKLDEKTEVCFDWLSRYAYGNADPKPASSFVGDLVMESGSRQGQADVQDNETESRTWLMGHGIVTITSKPRTGWVTITTRRPSGTVSMLCKLENVPLLRVGEDDADLRLLPAMMQSDRDFGEMSVPPPQEIPVIQAEALEVPAISSSSADTSQVRSIGAGKGYGMRADDLCFLVCNRNRMTSLCP